MSDLQTIARAQKLAEKGDVEGAWNMAEGVLMDDPNDALGLVLATYIMERSKNLVVAYHLSKRAVEIAPEKSATWTNLARCSDDLWLLDEAERAYRQSVIRSETKEIRAVNLSNLASLYVNTGRYVEGEKIASEAMKIAPGNRKVMANYGLSLLGQRKWDGWEYFTALLGTEYRKQVQFHDEPVWEGEKGKKLIVYGEQGLGDEVCFASMIPDAAKDCEKIALECDPKLANLFERSFPGVEVHGTRNAPKPWAQSFAPEASCSIGELGKRYRRTDEAFTGAPYLVADPERRLMWRALFNAKKKPCIGIAWTGGVQHTGEKFRTLTLKTLQPIFDAVDAHWVSLQYKNAYDEVQGSPVTQYPWATLTPDYDDTAAMVAELDFVICIQTAVAHLAGGLGKECWVLLPKNSQWRYGESGDSMPWYKSLKVIRQKELNSWTGPINKIVKMLHERFRADSFPDRKQAAG